MLKILTIVGTRPELIKMSRVIYELNVHTQHVLVHTGQNYDYELNKLLFEELGLSEPNYYLNTPGSSVAETIGNIIAKSDEVFEIEKPDALLLYGDTNSCLAVISAKRRKIPVFHMEAGNRCFDQRVPEELNRKIVDHLSDMNLVLSEHARRNLLSEGFKPEMIVKTGSHMYEVLNYYKGSIDKSNILEKLKLSKGDYFLFSFHREENLDNIMNLNELVNSIKSVSSYYKKKIIVSTHPRTQKRLLELDYLNLDPLISFLKPFGFFDYIKLQLNANCVVSDSGTITEESSILGFPSITIRNNHERPEGMDEGTLIMSGLCSKNIIDSINVVTKQSKSFKYSKPVADYCVENVSCKIIRLIYSYTHYINANIWHKTNRD
jgi:UDP-N-acetylglucosamine 2-epimerase (non-hydrolysing)